MIHQIVLAPETKSRRARTIFVPAHGSGFGPEHGSGFMPAHGSGVALKTSPPPHDGAPGSSHSKQRTPFPGTFQQVSPQRPTRKYCSRGSGLPIQEKPNPGAPGSPHSKQETPLNPQFQCSPSPALPKSTAGKPILEPTPPHDGAPGSPHSKQKTPSNPQFQCSPSPALPRSTAGKPVLEPTPPNEAPGSPHSKQKNPLNPQFQGSRPPALPKSTAGKPILEPASPNPGAPGLPQREQQIPLPPGQSVDFKLLSPKHRLCIRARLQPCRYRTRKTGALAPEARTPK
jgi:hypothetical protein